MIKVNNVKVRKGDLTSMLIIKYILNKVNWVKQPLIFSSQNYRCLNQTQQNERGGGEMFIYTESLGQRLTH